MRGLAVGLVIVMVIVGCEEQPSIELVDPTTSPSTQRAPMVKRIATTFEIDQYAASRPTTEPVEPVATAPATTQSARIKSPGETVDEMFQYMKENKVAEVRVMIVDPPDPKVLAAAVAQNHDELTHGGSWEVLETKVQGVVAVVVYRTTFSTGVVDISPIVLLKRYDKWKIMLGNYNPLRYTDAEKADLVPSMEWGRKRAIELRIASPTQPATQPAQTRP